MTTKLKRKRVKNIRLINFKTYDNAALKVKWYMNGTERRWGLNRGIEKHKDLYCFQLAWFKPFILC